MGTFHSAMSKTAKLVKIRFQISVTHLPGGEKKQRGKKDLICVYHQSVWKNRWGKTHRWYIMRIKTSAPIVFCAQ